MMKLLSTTAMALVLLTACDAPTMSTAISDTVATLQSADDALLAKVEAALCLVPYPAVQRRYGSNQAALDAYTTFCAVTGHTAAK